MLRYLHTSIDDAALMEPEGIGTAKFCPAICAGDSMKYVESKYWYHSIILSIIPTIYCGFIDIFKLIGFSENDSFKDTFVSNDPIMLLLIRNILFHGITQPQIH